MYIRVRVIPKAKKEAFIQTGEHTFEVHVKEKAERNQANTRMLALVEKHFSLLVGQARIINGHHHPIKLIAIPTD